MFVCFLLLVCFVCPHYNHASVHEVDIADYRKTETSIGTVVEHTEPVSVAENTHLLSTLGAIAVVFATKSLISVSALAPLTLDERLGTLINNCSG